MRIYIAAHASELAVGIAKIAKKMGHRVVSTWHDAPLEVGATLSDDAKVFMARRDVCQVMASDAVLLIAGQEKYSGGKFVEAGVALGLGKPVYVLGRRENVLLYADGCFNAAEIGFIE